MKHIFILAAAALMLNACGSDEPDSTSGSSVEAKVTASIDGVKSRAHDSQWEKGDAIGISTTSTGKTQYANIKYITALGIADFVHAGGNASGIFFQDTDDVTFSAYYPFVGTERTAAGVITDVTTENQAGQKVFDFLFASGAKASRNNPVLSFTGANAFSHKMSRLVINIVNDDNFGFTLDEVFGGIYTLSGLKHGGTFNTATGEASATGDTSAGWQINASPVDSDNQRTYSLILYPQTDADLTFTATIDGENYSCHLTPDLAAGVSYSYTVTVKKTGLEVSNCTINDWIGGGNEDVDANM